MGTGARFTAADYSHYTKTTIGDKPMDKVFTSSSLDPLLDPSKLKNGFRESVDLDDATPSTPIMVIVDETGSMGKLADLIIRTGLGVIMNEIIDRKPITDPHILIGGVGDAYFDDAPLQVSQFEVSVQPIIDQTAKIYIERGGGNNDGESYLLAWYFAALKTKTDSMLKRGKKGYLFTIGDEPPLMTLTKDQIKRVFGDDVQSDYTAQQLHDLAAESWEVFHLKVNPTRYNKSRWIDLMGQRVIDVSDPNALAEVIVSTIQILEGANVHDVTKSWSGDKSLVVASAVGHLTKTAAKSDLVAL